MTVDRASYGPEKVCSRVSRGTYVILLYAESVRDASILIDNIKNTCVKTIKVLEYFK